MWSQNQSTNLWDLRYLCLYVCLVDWRMYPVVSWLLTNYQFSQWLLELTIFISIWSFIFSQESYLKLQYLLWLNGLNRELRLLVVMLVQIFLRKNRKINFWFQPTHSSDKQGSLEQKFTLFHLIQRDVVRAYRNTNMTDEEAEEMIMSADGDGNGEVWIVMLNTLI